ncbi:MAG: hypothetical protein PHC33_02345 [Candidatus Omnitrophica bacterium]|nr:hypothetical protein [Candidatus Omnitrophota bacterium]
MLYDNGSNVGIGTTGPTNTLSLVGGSATAGAPSLTVDTRGVFSVKTYPTSSGVQLSFGGYTAAPFAMWVQSYYASNDTAHPLAINPLGGNVGIGNTSPGSLLDVNGTAQLRGTSGGTGLYVNSSSNVGIGTTAPEKLLHLSGDSGTNGATPVSAYLYSTSNGSWTDDSIFAQLLFGNADLNGAGDGGIKAKIAAYVDDVAAEDTGLSFYTSTSGTSIGERMRIDHAGNVGIGTTSPSALLTLGLPTTGYTTNLLAIGHTGSYPGAITMGNPSAVENNTGIYMRTTGTGFISTLTNGQLQLTTAGVGTTTNGIRINSAGNVGIGNTSPGSLLDVDGTAQLRGTSGGTGLYVNSSSNVGIGTTAPAYTLDVVGNIKASGTIYGGASGTQVPVGTGTANYVPKWSASGTLGNSVLYDNGGNVGIGTTGPTYVLDVNGAIRSTTRILSGATTASAYVSIANISRWWDIVNDYSDGTKLKITDVSAGATRITIDTSGNVGIGTTEPVYKLDIYGDMRLDATGGAGNLWLTDSNGSNKIYKNGNGAIGTNARFRVDGGSASWPSLSFISDSTTGFYLPASNNIGLSVAGSEKVRIDSSGNVGIGTTAPGNKLNVASANAGSSVGDLSLIGITNTDTTNNNTIGFGFSQANASGAIQTVAGIDLVGVSHADGAQSGALAFATRNAGSWGERLRIDPSGNVGIGTTNPSAALDVNSNIIRVRTAKTPASATAAGNTGDICWDANYVYICVATNTWKRAALSAW